MLTILVFLAVIVGGAYALRKLTLEENPDAGLALAGGGAADEAPTQVAPPRDAGGGT